MELHLSTDRTLLEDSAASVRHLLVRVIAPPPPPRTEARRPLDAALVLDRSGSMAGEKWQRAVEAATQIAERLTIGDRLAVVVFDDRIDTPLALSPAGGALRAQLTEALAVIGPRGCTDLCRGWLQGCALIGAEADADRLRRCFLLTDGLANQGLTEPAELVTHAHNLRQRGVITSTFGIGDDFDEAMLGPLADAGGGAFCDIARADQIGPALDRELGETLQVVSRGVTLDLLPTKAAAQAGLRIEQIGAWPQQSLPTQGLRLELGEMVGDQEIVLLLRIHCPAGTRGKTLNMKAELRSNELTTPIRSALRWTWASAAQVATQPIDADLLHRVAVQEASLARRNAVLANRQGELARSGTILTEVCASLRALGDDARIAALIDDLEDEAECLHERCLASREAKERYYASTNQAMSRTADASRTRRARE